MKTWAHILPLATHFLSEEKTTARGFTVAARQRLLDCAWPGNIRELANAVKHGAALATGEEVDDVDLPDELKQAPSSDAPRSHPSAAPGPTVWKTLAELERDHILQVLDACGGSQSEAAHVLGIARNTLW